jgi:hypothetical protein
MRERSPDQLGRHAPNSAKLLSFKYFHLPSTTEACATIRPARTVASKWSILIGDHVQLRRS